jgi:hypothetical protein
MSKNSMQMVTIAIMLTAITTLSVVLRPAEAVGNAQCGIGDIESDLATDNGRELGEGPSLGAHLFGGVGVYVAPQAKVCSAS